MKTGLIETRTGKGKGSFSDSQVGNSPLSISSLQQMLLPFDDLPSNTGIRYLKQVRPAFSLGPANFDAGFPDIFKKPAE